MHLKVLVQAMDMSVSFPRVKAIMWFDEIKSEAQAAGAVIDWRFSANQQILSGLSTFLAQPAQSTGQKYWLQLSDFTSGSKLPLSNLQGGHTAEDVSECHSLAVKGWGQQVTQVLTAADSVI